MSMLKSVKLSGCQVVKLSSCQVLFLGTRDMLNKFLFLCSCSNLTVYRRKWQWFFYTLSCEFRVHRAGSQVNYWYCTSVCICVMMSLWGSRIIIQLPTSISRKWVIRFTQKLMCEEWLVGTLCTLIFK